MRLGVMISGGGTTYEFIARAISEGRLDAEIVRVVSSRAKAGGVEKARAFGHPVTVVNTKDPGHQRQIADLFLADRVDLVVMAGYMHLWKLPPELKNRAINLHPALIPAFCGKGMYGRHVHEAAIRAGVRISGCTVHIVDDQYDHGKILEQRAVFVESTDTPESLEAKIQPVEKAMLLDVITKWDQYGK